MKIKTNPFNRWGSYLSKICLILGTMLLLPSMSLNAQNQKVTITSDQKTLAAAFDAIEKQTKMNIAYNEASINVKQAINVNIANAPLSEAMSTVLKGTNTSYKIQGKQIIIVADLQQSPKRKYTGKVLDNENEPIIGASITVKGNSSIGTATDIDGNFSIDVPSGSTLLVSYLGYQSKDVTVGNTTSLNIKMEPAAKELSSVVVTALGIKREEKALSYNAQQVKSDDLLKNKDANFINALSGKVAGVTINSSSSGVGGASKVVMRGQKGIAQSSNALYVIDGLPMFNQGGSGGTEFDSKGVSEAIADINPEDIESMTVLTGAAAAALYGSNAANGAIVITTKKGKAGVTSLTVSQSTEFRNVLVSPKFQNRYGTGMNGVMSQSTNRSWGSLLNPSNYVGYNPKKDYLKTGVVATESVTFSTGTDKNQTFASAAAINSVGIIPNNAYDRYNFSFRNTSSFLNDKLTLDVGANYINQYDRNMINQGEYGNPLVSAYLYPRGDNWDAIQDYERWNSSRKIYSQYWPSHLEDGTMQNPYWINYRNLKESKKDRYMYNASVSYDIYKWLNVAGRIRIDNSNTKFTEKLYATSNLTLLESKEGERNDKGLYGYEIYNDKQLYGDILVNINNLKLADRLFLQANLGISMSNMSQGVDGIRGPLKPDSDESLTIPNVFMTYQIDHANAKYKYGGYDEKMRSIFSSFELGYKSAYYLTLTARNDWASQLQGPFSNQKSFFYPSVGTSFVLSEIFPMPKQLDFAKLRGSFASVGIPFPRFIANQYYPWSDKTNSYDSQSVYPMSNLKPEKTNSWEVGLNLRFLKNFNLDMSWYYAKTFNQTIDTQISASSGYKTWYAQTGSVRNTGIELMLGYDNTFGNLYWSSTYTLSSNSNKILELVRNYKHPISGEIINKSELNMGGLNNAVFILKEGGSLGDMYSLSDFKRDANGDIFVDQDNNIQVVNLVNEGKAPIKVGSIFPKANMAWNNSFAWKNINLSFLVSARLGGIVYSATQATLDQYGVSEASASARDNGGVFINDGNNFVDAQMWYTSVGNNKGIPQMYTYSATNVRLQELSLGYTFSKKQLWGVGEATVSLVGRNLFMIYNKAPFDPESVATTSNYYEGIDNYMLPSTRNLGFNVRLKF